MESALAVAEHVRSGKEYWGDPGLFVPTRPARSEAHRETNAPRRKIANTIKSWIIIVWENRRICVLGWAQLNASY